ncbi:MAG TPA: adenylate/guanylate cyclase domain-containing protein [Acidimicrobiia bacterium]|nr:adenylate/guanylate cyclase domain-containing protein [Acidimicrobiia bacterium]
MSIKQPNRAVLRVQLVEPLEIGRECDGLLLADPQMSRRHARLEGRGTDVMIEDLGSTNGTFLDGERCDMAFLLRAGSTVRVGDTFIELVPMEETPAMSAEAAGGGARETTVTGAASDGVMRASGDQPAGARETSIDAVARAVRNTSPVLKDYDYEGTITIVFSDIESSTERATAMGDTAWFRLLNKHNEIVRRSVKKFGGREVKNQGDGFMLTFPGARRALNAMIEVQRELTTSQEADGDEAIRVRVGVHTGEVIAEGGDIFGRHVMFAARVAAQAQGGEILVSAIVREIASARGDLQFGEPRTVELKGIEGEHVVFPVVWS